MSALMTRTQVREAAARIAAASGVAVRIEERLAPHLSMRVGGPVPAFLEPRTTAQLVDVLQQLSQEDVPHRILGGGSNLLAEDEGLDFAVVHAGALAEPIRWEGPVARAAGGTALSALLREAALRGMTGLEWAAGLPGTVGGAVVGNAGAFGGEIGASVREVVLLSPGGLRRVHVVQPGDFAYRRSFVAEGDVVLEALVELAPDQVAAVRAETDRVNRARAGSQPKGGHSSGCMFKNPPGAHAGKIIDGCGLKGFARGGAHVSRAHANFVVNDGSATAADVLGLIQDVARAVRERTGTELESEVRAWRGEAS